MSDEVKIDWTEISKRGLLKRINSEIMHPLGLAVFRDPDSGMSGGALVSPDGKWVYADEAEGEPPIQPEWITKLRKELMLSKMTHNFTFSRDEVIDLLGGKFALFTPEAPRKTQNLDALLQWAYDQNYHGHAAASAELKAINSVPEKQPTDDCVNCGLPIDPSCYCARGRELKNK